VKCITFRDCVPVVIVCFDFNEK